MLEREGPKIINRGRGGDPGHHASRHIRGHGDVRDRAVAPYPTSTIFSGTGAAVRQAASTTIVGPLARGGAVHRVGLGNIPPAFWSLRDYHTRNNLVVLLRVAAYRP
jgi:hypothetical protein